MRLRRPIVIASLMAAGLALSGCSTFDPTEWFNTKKPLPGERKAVFPEGVPGVSQGVPPELVQGYIPPTEPVPEPLPVPQKPKAQPRPKPAVAAAPRPAAVPPAQQQQSQSQQGGSAPWPNATPAQPAGQSPFPDPPRR